MIKHRPNIPRISSLGVQWFMGIGTEVEEYLLFKIKLFLNDLAKRDLIVMNIIQGVFFHTGPPPKSSKYRKVDLGEVRSI